jgi:tripartite-type tricarboxylate transporter receptor subunit TctC
MAHLSRRPLLGALVASVVPRRFASAQGTEGGAWTPNRPIRIVSPYTPGGGTDTTARLIAPAVGEFLGQTVVVENRTGGGGSIGAAAVAEALPDGHTLMVDALAHVVNPHLMRGLRFDYARAFAAVSQVTIQRQILAVPAGLPVSTLAEFVAWAKERPGRLSYGSSGNASGAHLAAVLFLRETGLDITHVPYRGGSAVIPDLIGGTVVFAFATGSSAVQLVQEGRLKALAIASSERLGALPAVPTMAEASYPAVVVDEWNTLFAPAGTPPEALERVHAALLHALAQPAVRERFAQVGAWLVGSPPMEAARYIAAQRDAMGRLVREANITIE